MAVQLHRRVDTNALDRPNVAGWFPQHWDRFNAGVIEEILSVLKVVLGSDANYLENVFVVSSELLDVGAVAPTGRSMGGPVPNEYRPIAGDYL